MPVTAEVSIVRALCSVLHESMQEVRLFMIVGAFVKKSFASNGRTPKQRVRPLNATLGTNCGRASGTLVVLRWVNVESAEIKGVMSSAGIISKQ